MARPPAGSVAGLKNLGPTTAALLREVGVETADELRRVGSAMAYKLLTHRFPDRTNMLFLYAMEGALQGRNLLDFSPEEKARLKAEASGTLEVGAGGG